MPASRRVGHTNIILDVSRPAMLLPCELPAGLAGACGDVFFVPWCRSRPRWLSPSSKCPPSWRTASRRWQMATMTHPRSWASSSPSQPPRRPPNRQPTRIAGCTTRVCQYLGTHSFQTSQFKVICAVLKSHFHTAESRTLRMTRAWPEKVLTGQLLAVTQRTALTGQYVATTHCTTLSGHWGLIVLRIFEELFHGHPPLAQIPQVCTRKLWPLLGILRRAQHSLCPRFDLSPN